MKKLELTDEELGFIYTLLRPRVWYHRRKRKLSPMEIAANKIQKNLRQKIMRLLPKGSARTIDTVFATLE